MKRLKLLFFLFALSVAVPLVFFVVHAFDRLEQEELAELRFFGETMFARMEEELASLVAREEGRGVDEYALAPGEKKPGSVLSALPRENYILGYFQNNADGGFQSPLGLPERLLSEELAPRVRRLQEINRLFNARRTSLPEPSAAPAPAEQAVEKQEQASLAAKYLDVSRQRKEKASLGQEAKRLEEITIVQAENVAGPDQEEDNRSSWSSEGWKKEVPGPQQIKGGDKDEAWKSDVLASPVPATLQVEIDPLQAAVIDNEHIFMFRRLVLHDRIVRQGFVLEVEKFLDHLSRTHFRDQPLAGFTGLRLAVWGHGREMAISEAGVRIGSPGFVEEHTFPRPFSFLRATLAGEKIPASTGRRTIEIMTGVLAFIMILGLVAIYRSTRAVVELSERRAGFVSSVTHELKTPLTTIRLYLEMLSQGIARTQNREQEYYRIMLTETGRLSRLINNVLQFAKLEKKQQTLVIEEGGLSEVIDEVTAIMSEKLRQEGFTLEARIPAPVSCRYDREAMIQILINLLENSIKFGQGCPSRKIVLQVQAEGKRVLVSVRDTGPGIPSHGLKKIFDDFYRVDDSLTRRTKGTGIGLALVKKLATAMGGTVTARNNDGPGCTISISLPSAP